MTLLSLALTVYSQPLAANNLLSAALMMESANALRVSQGITVYNRVRIYRFTPRSYGSRLTLGFLLVCGSLAGDHHRPPKGDGPCECDEGWSGINCNGSC